MKAARVWILLGSWALAAVGGCGKVDSDPLLKEDPSWLEPRWLQQCSNGSGRTECGSFSLECVCGVCTRSCTSDSECTGENFEGICSEGATTPYANVCQSTAPEKICIRAPGTGTPRMGMPLDEASSCYGAEELAGFSSDSVCRPVQMVAISPAGPGPRCWLFPDSCLPDGFIDANSNPLIAPPCGLPEINICPETLSCDAGQAPTSKGCLSCDEARRGLALDVVEFVARAELARCTYDTDCVTQGWDTGCDGQCPTAVGRDNVGVFQRALPELTRDYCSDPAQWRANCAQRSTDCDNAALCRRGRCVISTLPCRERELADCESDGDCALARANPFNATAQCFDTTSTAVACGDPDFTCPPVVRAALDPDGNCFRLDGCLPPDFNRAPAEHPCAAALSSLCAF